MSSISMISVVFVIVLFSVAIFLRRAQGAKPLPPGPAGFPIIGNTHNIPAHESWKYFASLKEKFGDVVCLRIFNQKIVILNSFEAIQDLLNKRGELYSDRPRTVMAGKIMGHENSLAMVPYGDNWRTQRRLFHSHLMKDAITEYHDFVLKEARAFIGRLHADPKAYYEEVRLTSGKLILGVTYGIDIHSTKDPLITDLDEANHAAVEALAYGKYFVDIMPWMLYIPSWFPFAGWKSFGQRMGKKFREANRTPFEITRKALADGSAKPSFTAHLLQDELAVTVSEETKMWLSGVMYTAGGHTTAESVIRFFYAMVMFPEVQERAAEEIERVIGKERLPDIGDKDTMPYLDGLLKEIFRWHTMAPISVPHRLTADDEYRGYHLPEGTVFIPNSWSIAMDPQMYPNPEKFEPERHIPSDGKPTPLDPRQFAFGYGRRICPGRDFAEVTVWSNIATLLATTRILRPVDEKGKEYTPALKLEGDALSRIAPFKCRIEVRSKHLHDLAVEEAAASTA